VARLRELKKEFYQFGLQSGELRSGVKIGRIALTWPSESKDLNRLKVSPVIHHPVVPGANHARPPVLKPRRPQKMGSAQIDVKISFKGRQPNKESAAKPLCRVEQGIRCTALSSGYSNNSERRRVARAAMTLLKIKRHSRIRSTSLSVISSFSTVHDQHLRRARAAAVPPGIRCEIESLETDFANDLSIDEVADQAQLSRSHFALTFQCTSNKDHKRLQKPPFL
jgi:AraC-like DNA-binding protein